MEHIERFEGTGSLDWNMAGQLRCNQVWTHCQSLPGLTGLARSSSTLLLALIAQIPATARVIDQDFGSYWVGFSAAGLVPEDWKWSWDSLGQCSGSGNHSNAQDLPMLRI